MDASHNQAFDDVLKDFADKRYEFWERLIGQKSIIVPYPKDDTKEIEIVARWDEKPGGVIRVLVSALHSTRFGIVLPTRSFLVHKDNRIEGLPFTQHRSDNPT